MTIKKMAQPSVFIFLTQKYLYMENKTKQARSILTSPGQLVRSQWVLRALSISGPVELAVLYTHDSTHDISLKSKFISLADTSLLYKT